MYKPVLVILAAGLGSRYGGMKQIDGVGSHGEPIIDFSIYDAWKAGFSKVVLIIKREHEEAFRTVLTDEIAKHMPVEFVYQDMEDLPEGITVPEGRTKPWGTTHALLACKGKVREPFAIINADDFYGRSAFVTMYRYLTENIEDNHYVMVGYQCKNTLTDNGTVTRGVCEMDENHMLAKITEVHNIRKENGHAVYEDNGVSGTLADDALVSMNFWGFTPKIFAQVEDIFAKFLKENIGKDPLKCEHVIPAAVEQLILQKACDVKMLMSEDTWFGVTYQADKPGVMKAIAEKKEKGEYPDRLWE